MRAEFFDKDILLSAADRAEDGDSHEESAFGDDKPGRRSRRPRSARLMDLSDHQEQVIPFAAIGIRRKLSCRDAPPES